MSDITKMFTAQDFVSLADSVRSITDLNPFMAKVTFWDCPASKYSYREGRSLKVFHHRFDDISERDTFTICHDNTNVDMINPTPLFKVFLEGHDSVYVNDYYEYTLCPFENANVLAQAVMFLYCEKVKSMRSSIAYNRDAFRQLMMSSKLIDSINNDDVAGYR